MTDTAELTEIARLEGALEAIAKLLESQGPAVDVETLAMIVRLSGRDVDLPEGSTPGADDTDLAKRIQAWLFPEYFGVDHELHDADHPYWQTDQDGGYAWDLQTMDAVHSIVEEYVAITDMIEQPT